MPLAGMTLALAIGSRTISPFTIKFCRVAVNHNYKLSVFQDTVVKINVVFRILQV